MQRLIEAAKELRVRLVEHGLRYGEQCQISHHELLAAIRDAERQAADDALPITQDWAQIEFRDIASWSEQVGYFLKFPCCSIKWNRQREVLDINGVDVPHIKTRGQLRRLIEALKGGEA